MSNGTMSNVLQLLQSIILLTIGFYQYRAEEISGLRGVESDEASLGTGNADQYLSSKSDST